MLGAGILASTTLLPSESRASDWGCQVLLCISGDWQAEPTCHPPMYKLIAAMKLPGFSWPVCPTANGSGHRFQPYEDCPDGWSEYSTNDSDRGSTMANRCRINADKWKSPIGPGIRNPVTGNASGTTTIGDKDVSIDIITETNDRGSQKKFYEMDRPTRDKPYYIEYDDANGKRQRAWFNLNMP